MLNPAVIKVGDEIKMFYRAIRRGNHSTIGYCVLDKPLTVSNRLDKPFMVPEHDYERHGIEDPA
ncbi:hypothetical protein [Mucilaginibacter antarcticus]|uniref:hypothetical protein n=1 Tax=Mucilaginibacter antarcticus TaxID=1855725 RepID=UPI00362C2AD2